MPKKTTRAPFAQPSNKVFDSPVVLLAKDVNATHTPIGVRKQGLSLSTPPLQSRPSDLSDGTGEAASEHRKCRSANRWGHVNPIKAACRRSHGSVHRCFLVRPLVVRVPLPVTQNSVATALLPTDAKRIARQLSDSVVIPLL